MDDFLRRVLARREAEQELRINMTMGAELPSAKGEWRRRDKRKKCKKPAANKPKRRKL